MMLYIILSFILTPLDSSHVYLTTNGYAQLNFELYNNGYFSATYNLVVRKHSAPSDLSFQMCFQNQCFLGDSQAITVEAGNRDTITLDFIGGSETGPIDIYYLVYDQHETQDRDSVELTGGVPVQEHNMAGKNNLCFDGKYIRGSGVKYAMVYSQDGRFVTKLFSGDNKISTVVLKRGVYLAIVHTKEGKKILKFAKE